MTSLYKEFMTVFAQNDFGVCIKDVDNTVLMQDEQCPTICRSRTGSRCLTGCMAVYESDKKQQWESQGSRFYKSVALGNEYFDVHFLCGKKHIVTFLVPLEKQQSKALSFYEKMDLTRREMEIISMVIQGNSNKFIAERLAISRATLKSHLNSVYRKTREKGASPEYIPANRITS